MEKVLNGIKKCSIKIQNLENISSFPELLKALAYILEDEAKECQEEQEPIITVERAIERVAEKMGVSYDSANKILAKVAKVNPAAAFTIIVKELAIELDQKYEGLIKDSKEIFGISLFDGKVHELNKDHIKSYKNFAAFRTSEDAKLVCNLLRDKLKDMFKGSVCKTTEK